MIVRAQNGERYLEMTGARLKMLKYDQDEANGGFIEFIDANKDYTPLVIGTYLSAETFDMAKQYIETRMAQGPNYIAIPTEEEAKQKLKEVRIKVRERAKTVFMDLRDSTYIMDISHEKHWSDIETELLKHIWDTDRKMSNNSIALKIEEMLDSRGVKRMPERNVHKDFESFMKSGGNV